MRLVLYVNGEDGGSSEVSNRGGKFNRIRTNSISACENDSTTCCLDDNEPSNVVDIHEFCIEKQHTTTTSQRSSIRKLVEVKHETGTRNLFVIIKTIMLLLSLANSILNLNVNVVVVVSGARTPKPSFSYSDDLIEGRLDTSQLCGTRYSGGPFQYGQPRYDMEVANSNYLGTKSNSKPTAGHADDHERNQIDADHTDHNSYNTNSNINSNDNNNINQKQNEKNLLYIVGGDEVDDDQFWPWSVAIYELDPLNGQKAFICSGSLISEKFILTAAHCIQQSRFDILTANEIFLKIASVRLDDDRSRFYHVESVFVHPDYSVDRKANDIALLRLQFGQRLPARARPICLPSHVANRIDFTDQMVTIIGWGKTTAMQGNEPSRLIDVESGDGDIDEASFSPALSGLTSVYDVDGTRLQREYDNKKNSSKLNNHNNNNNNNNNNEDASQTNDTLLQAEVRVTNTDQCNKNYSKLEISWLSIDEHFLCASDPQGKRDACQGDSGGPLMWNNQQALMGQQQHHHQRASSPEKWYQLGLVSFGYGCANKQYPGVYTRISYYMPWILKIVNGKGNNLSSSSSSSSSSHYINHRSV